MFGFTKLRKIIAKLESENHSLHMEKDRLQRQVNHLQPIEDWLNSFGIQRLSWDGKRILTIEFKEFPTPEEGQDE